MVPSAIAASPEAVARALALAEVARHPQLGVRAALLTSRSLPGQPPLSPPLPLPLIDPVFGVVADFAETGHPTDADRDAAAALCAAAAVSTGGTEAALGPLLRDILSGLISTPMPVVTTELKKVQADGVVLVPLPTVEGIGGGGARTRSVPALVLEVKVSGGTDPWFQNAVYYLHYLPWEVLPSGDRVLPEALLSAEPRLPALLLDLTPGGVLLLRGAALTLPAASTEVLGTAILATDSGSFMRVARLLGAVRIGVAALQSRYRGLRLAAGGGPAVALPSAMDAAALFNSRELARLGITLHDVCMPDRLVFRGRIASLDGAGGGGGGAGGGGGGGARAPTEVVVKFVRGAYGADAHRHAADAGHAPALLHVWPWPGGWRVIVMDALTPMVWARLDQGSDEEVRAALAAYDVALAAGGFVHGDLRPSNILVWRLDEPESAEVAAAAGPPAKRPRPSSPAAAAAAAGRGGRGVGVMFVDFDWAGKAGEARYPMLHPMLARVYDTAGAHSGAVITADADRAMIAGGPRPSG